LRTGIESLPGRKLIFTNADAPYAQRVLAARGLDGVFEVVFDIHRMEHKPKPALDSYHALCSQLDINPTAALFVEDSAHNLE
ncbi:HAD-IA family hydrolase, partial [Mycobacterium tuberculosis]|nr:HAD-IA family hydrolase [Mycobacterium tuberculosis]